MNKLKNILLSLILCASTAWAGPYVELGIGVKLGPNTQDYGCISDKDKYYKLGCSDNPLGIAAIGYEYKGFSLQAEHQSSLQEKDRGLDVMSIRYRYRFYE